MTHSIGMPFRVFEFSEMKAGAAPTAMFIRHFFPATRGRRGATVDGRPDADLGKRAPVRFDRRLDLVRLEISAILFPSMEKVCEVGAERLQTSRLEEVPSFHSIWAAEFRRAGDSMLDQFRAEPDDARARRAGLLIRSSTRRAAAAPSPAASWAAV
jgi:hypothetical protein